MAYLNDKKLFTVVRTEGITGNVPNLQATTTVVADALTNVNGWYLTSYEQSPITISGYTGILITKGGNNLTEADALTYMEAMTGSKFVPTYDFNKPQYSLFIFADFTIWKPQFDETNGLVLYAMGQLANANNFVTLTQAQYDALVTKDPNTYYFIVEE